MKRGPRSRFYKILYDNMVKERTNINRNSLIFQRTKNKYRNKGNLFFVRGISLNSALNTTAVVLCRNSNFKRFPLVSLNGKDRFAFAMISKDYNERTEILPMSSTQGPGDYTRLSETFRNDGRRYEQNITEKFSVSEKTKTIIQVFSTKDTGLPGVTNVSLLRRLANVEGVILNRINTESQFLAGVKEAALKKTQLFAENE